MKKSLLIFCIISILLISACSQQPAQTKSQPKITISEKNPAAEAPAQAKAPAPEKTASAEENTAAPTSGVKEFDITAKQFEFIPSVITVNKGDKVRLDVKSIDVTHGFSILEYGINENINPGKTTIIEFTADKTGEFAFFCSVYCGTGHSGMKGKLVVE